MTVRDRRYGGHGRRRFAGPRIPLGPLNIVPRRWRGQGDVAGSSDTMASKACRRSQAASRSSVAAWARERPAARATYARAWTSSLGYEVGRDRGGGGLVGVPTGRDVAGVELRRAFADREREPVDDERQLGTAARQVGGGVGVLGLVEANGIDGVREGVGRGARSSTRRTCAQRGCARRSAQDGVHAFGQRFARTVEALRERKQVRTAGAVEGGLGHGQELGGSRVGGQAAVARERRSAARSSPRLELDARVEGRVRGRRPRQCRAQRRAERAAVLVRRCRAPCSRPSRAAPGRRRVTMAPRSRCQPLAACRPERTRPKHALRAPGEAAVCSLAGARGRPVTATRTTAAATAKRLCVFILTMPRERCPLFRAARRRTGVSERRRAGPRRPSLKT